LRVSWVFSADGQNFVKTMLRLGRERAEVRVVDDQRGCPTAADDIAHAVLVGGQRLLDDPGVAGTYHFAGSAPVTWHDFAAEIFARAAARGVPPPRLAAIPTRDYPTPARRPANSVLATQRWCNHFGEAAPDWRSALDRVLDRLLREPAVAS